MTKHTRVAENGTHRPGLRSGYTRGLMAAGAGTREAGFALEALAMRITCFRTVVLCLFFVALVATSRILHESLATAGMGVLFFIYAIPVLSLAFVIWAVAGRRLSDVGPIRPYAPEYRSPDRARFRTPLRQGPRPAPRRAAIRRLLRTRVHRRRRGPHRGHRASA